MSECREYVTLLDGMYAKQGMFHPFLRLLLDHGRLMTAKQHAVTGTMRMGGCYRNATETMMSGEGLHYCEGIALKRGLIPLNHAWLVDADGQVVDPTWKELDTEYLGLIFKDEFVFEMLDKMGHWGISENLYMLRKPHVDVYELLKAGLRH